jgi:hypothetical protein
MSDRGMVSQDSFTAVSTPGDGGRFEEFKVKVDEKYML